MPSTYTSDKGQFEKQATGENDSTWGTKLNAVLDDIGTVTCGSLSKSVAGSSDVTLTTAEARNRRHVLTGALTGNIAYIVPAVVGGYAVYNNTSGAFSVTVKTASGTGIVVAQGYAVELFCDGTNVVRLGSELLSSNNLSDLVNSATARTNLGLGSAATHAHSDYATAAQGTLADGAAQKASNLSDLANAATARTNLGLGSLATASSVTLANTSGVTTGKLVGRSTAGTGALEEITLGANLSFTGSTLNVSGVGTGTVTSVATAGMATGGPISSTGTVTVSIDAQTAETAPETGDEVAIYDVSAAAHRKMTLADLLKVINRLTADASPDTAADYVMTYDASAAAVKKVLLSALGGGGALSFVSSATASSSSTVDFTGLASGYDYIVTHSNLDLSVFGEALYVQLGTGGGPTWDTGSVYDYSNTLRQFGSNSVAEVGATTKMKCTGGFDDVAGTMASFGEIKIRNPASTSGYHMVTWANETRRGDADLSGVYGGGVYKSTTAVTGIRILPGSGVITAGVFNLYKLARS